MVREISVPEHGEITIPISRLFWKGEFALDPRIESRGYFSTAISGGRLSLRATRFVGLIPLTPDIAVRVLPGLPISNLGRMMVRGSDVPAVVENFARGYIPLLAPNTNAVEAYHLSLLSAVERLLKRGVMRDYVRISPPPNWRGRLLVSDTVRSYLAHGVRYRKSFEFTTLSADIPANQVIKLALKAVSNWATAQPKQKRAEVLSKVNSHLSRFEGVRTVEFRPDIISLVPKLAASLPTAYRYYSECLWMAYAIVQQVLPDPGLDGYASLDSIIVDVSAVFEGYVRHVLRERLGARGILIEDGNEESHRRPFFADRPTEMKVKPDIIVRDHSGVLAIFDAKYKPGITEHDRYELLSFMEASGVERGAFLCPRRESQSVREPLGITRGGHQMSIIRIDLAAKDFETEEEKFAAAAVLFARPNT